MLTLKVFGMTCSKCADAVTSAVRNLPSVQDVIVDLERGQVTVKGNPDVSAVRAAIAEEGYGVENAA